MLGQFKMVQHIITPSQFCGDEVIRLLRVPPKRVTVTPLAVHDQFQQAPAPAAERAATLGRLGVRRPYVLYVGGYEPHKNVAGLLETFAVVKRIRPDLALVTVGSKLLPDELAQHAQRLGLVPGRDVVFLVNLTRELNDLYDEAALFATLSWRETFCLPALEAMTRGVGVVASAWGAAPEVVGNAGRLVDPRDHAAASSAIVSMLEDNDPEARRQRSLKQARQFRWVHTAEKTVEVYRSLVARRRGRGKPTGQSARAW